MKTRVWIPEACALSRPTFARWLNERSLRPAVSVTSAAFFASALAPVAIATRPSEATSTPIAMLVLRNTFTCPSLGEVDPAALVGRLIFAQVGRSRQVCKDTPGSARAGRCRQASGAVELCVGDEHPARLRSLVARDDPAPLEHVDQPPGARVADPESPLEERDRSGLRLHDDVDRLVEERILVR